jgi:hypothetical protein
MDILVVQLAIVFLPGLMWARLDAKYAQKNTPAETEVILRAFVFGLATYAVVYVLYGLFGKPFSMLIVPSASNPNMGLAEFVDEIAWSIPVALVLAILWVMSVNKKWLTRFLQLIGATNKFGDEDVWDFTFNSGLANVEYVHVRDFDNHLVHAGWVDTFSESGKLRELLLTDVQTYDFTGRLVSETPVLYIAREPTNIHIEFPYEEKTSK